MRIETAITRLLGIDLPICQAGMSWASSSAALPLAVAEAGGLGVIAAGPMRDADLGRVIDEVRDGTSRPFAVNMPLYRQGADEVLDLLERRRISVLIASQGGPKRYLDRFNAIGTTCIHVVAGTEHAVKASDAGVDGIECPKPVIAAVGGAAIGAGCVLALLCDILIVAEEAFMSMTEVDYGLAGGVRHVLRSFSPSDARLMVYLAKRITGPELFRMNVASACVPRAHLLEEVTSIARGIAEKVPLAVVAAKRSFGLTEEMPLRDGYRNEQSQTAALAETEDTQEALAAFREKRKPVFKGR